MWVTALVLGFAGSLHCAGMCSPLAFAVSNMTSTVLRNRLVYNTGRILVYAIVGAIFSAAGVLLAIEKYQHLLSIMLGVMLLIISAAGVRGIRIPMIPLIVQRFTGFLKKKFAAFLQRRHKGSILLLGALNGLLPCGLSFLALTYCITLRGPQDGFNFMLVFGLGTLPAMFGLPFVFELAMKKLKVSFQRINTAMIFVSGLLLIARVLLDAGAQAHANGQNMMDVVLCR